MSDYIIGSFNIQHLNNTKDFDKLAEIIEHGKFDVVAIQEARGRGAVKSIALALGSKWDYACPRGNEEYAFIWNTMRLRLREFPKNKENPQIVRNFHPRKTQGEAMPIRPPYVGYFTAQGLFGGCKFDIRIINTHIAFSKPSYVPNYVSESNARRNELTLITRNIYDQVATRQIEGAKSIFTVLLGDFNLVLEGTGDKIQTLWQARYGEYEYYTWNGNKMKFEQREKTTLKQPTNYKIDSSDLEEIAEMQEQEIANDGDYYSRNYDHFGYDESLKSKYSIKCSRVDAVELYDDANKLEIYRKKISDHVPIKMEITLI